MKRNMLLAAASTLAFFALVEAGLRLSGLVPTDALRSPDIRTLDTIPGLFEPGQDLVDRIRPELPYRIRINELGFRGAGFAARKPEGVLRVLCLGDSYTFGHHVGDDEAWPAVLDRSLKARGPAVEAINAGANGFTILDEMIFLQAKGLGLDPDVIVLAFSQNDIADLARPQPMIESMREHAELKGAFLVGPALKVLQRTALFNTMQRTAAWMRVRSRRFGEAARSPAGLEPLWPEYKAALSAMAGLCRSRGIGFLLVIWPSAEQVLSGASAAPQERLARAADSLGVPHLDLTPVLVEAARRGVRPFLVPLDGHPSAEGHAVAARAIAARLEDLGLLTPAEPAPVREAGS